jgi:D-lactate dehydrogenase (cytochrome)
MLGYTLASKDPVQHDYLESPKYGSPRDFQKGIKELREVFSPRGIVSTDPEVLESHGFSTMNSYHPG